MFIRLHFGPLRKRVTTPYVFSLHPCASLSPSSLSNSAISSLSLSNLALSRALLLHCRRSISLFLCSRPKSPHPSMTLTSPPHLPSSPPHLRPSTSPRRAVSPARSLSPLPLAWRRLAWFRPASHGSAPCCRAPPHLHTSPPLLPSWPPKAPPLPTSSPSPVLPSLRLSPPLCFTPLLSATISSLFRNPRNLPRSPWHHSDSRTTFVASFPQHRTPPPHSHVHQSKISAATTEVALD